MSQTYDNEHFFMSHPCDDDDHFFMRHTYDAAAADDDDDIQHFFMSHTLDKIYYTSLKLLTG